MNKSLLSYFLILLLSFSLFGCVASSSYYTGRTLEKNKFAFGFGADDILMKDSKSSSSSVGISKSLPFAPSLEVALGLPLRLEAGLRWYPTRFLEGTLREQLNPRDFNLFDCSLDVSYAGLIGAYSYLKYGATISKNIHEFEPFFHYYFYHSTGKMKSLTNSSLDGFITNLSTELINNSHTVGFGIGLPLHKVKFYPTIDYQYYNNDLSLGIWQFGIGIRVFTN